jgi:hypothetical protein
VKLSEPFGICFTFGFALPLGAAEAPEDGRGAIVCTGADVEGAEVSAGIEVDGGAEVDDGIDVDAGIEVDDGIDVDAGIEDGAALCARAAAGPKASAAAPARVTIVRVIAVLTW